MYKYLAIQIAEDCTEEEYRETLAGLVNDPNITNVQYLLGAHDGFVGDSYRPMAMVLRSDGTVAAVQG